MAQGLWPGADSTGFANSDLVTVHKSKFVALTGPGEAWHVWHENLRARFITGVRSHKRQGTNLHQDFS